METLKGKYYLLFYLLFAFSCWAAIYFQQYIWLGVGFGVVAGLWVSNYPRVLFYILIASIPWSVEYSVGSGFSTDLPDEPLMLALSFLLVAILIQRRKDLPLRLGSSVILLLLLAQAGWYVISVACSTMPVISIKFLLAKGWYLLAFVGAPLFLLNADKHIGRMGGVLATSMVSVTVIALVRHGYYGFTFEDINASLKPFFRNHVNYSALLVCMVPILVAWLVLAPSKALKRVLGLALIVTLAALYFSYARGAWLALFTGAAAYWLLRKRLLVYTYVFALVLSVAAIIWLKADNRYLRYAHDYNTTIFHTNFKEHLVATYKLKDVSTAERFYRWIAGVRMVKDSWITGFGPNTFYYNYRPYTITAFKTWVSRNEERSTVHNFFLLTLIEQGAVGLLLFLVLVGYLLYVAQCFVHRTQDRFWRVVISTVAVILIMLCTVNFLSDLIETDKVGSIFYLCTALLILAEAKYRQRSELAADV